MPLHEDLRRYTAPPDNPPSEPTYSIEQIHAYLDCWIPMNQTYLYTLDEVREILKESTHNLTDDDYGIQIIDKNL